MRNRETVVADTGALHLVGSQGARGTGRASITHVRRRFAPRPPAPLAGIESLYYGLGGIVVPAFCFLAAASGDEFNKPASKESGWRGVLGLFFHRDANWGFGLLLLASAIALGAVLTGSKRHAKAVPVRVLIAGGAVVSATFLVVGSLSHRELFLPVNLAALALCVIVRRVVAAYPPAAHLALVVLLLLALVSGLFVFLLFFVPLSGPAWAFAAYTSMWRRLRAEVIAERVMVEAFGDPFPAAPVLRPFLPWLAGYGAAFGIALVQARRLFEELPEHHTDCYVATVAARGHPRLVRSWDAAGRRVNAQLVWLKAGELVLVRLAPRLHRLVRRAYDRVGPGLAACVRRPLAADLAYLSLKPLEWAVRAAFLAAGRRAPKGRGALN